MMDNFEKQIKENKLLFDDQKADKAKLWAHIESRLDDSGKEPKIVSIRKSTLFKVAAGFAIIAGLFSIIVFLQYFNPEEKNVVINSELRDTNSYYQTLVSHQVELVKNHPKLTSADKKEFLSFMEALDEEYEILKSELESNLDNDRVLEAIVENYKKRIEIIENFLRQINDSKELNQDENVYIL